MEVKFQTKEESKQQQLEAFLKLSGGERVWRFFSLSAQINRLPRKNKQFCDTSRPQQNQKLKL